MLQLEKKAKRLNPVIEERQAKFDIESEKLNIIRQRKIELVAAMRAKQQEYMDGVTRLNEERGTSNRLMLDALETGLDSVKNQWMALYQSIIQLEKEEKNQVIIMSKAHRDLEAIKTLQTKYKTEFAKEMDRREQKMLDEHSLRKFVRETR
jgi:flagellar biosynthesis chaperone FliJ